MVRVQWITVSIRFFYFRDDDYVADLPKEPHQLKRIYSDNAEGDSDYRDFLLSKMSMLKDEIIPNTGRPIRLYQAIWDNQGQTPEIAMPVLCPALLEDNIARWQREWMKVLNLNEPIVGRELPADLLAAGNEYNHKLTSGRLGDFRVGMRLSMRWSLMTSKRRLRSATLSIW